MKDILTFWAMNLAKNHIGMSSKYVEHLDCPKDGGILVWIETTNTKSAAGILPKKVNRFMSYGNFTVQSLKYYHEKHK
tara:strand:- start:429 stop:662 length:234 start_codon:yes stop_codon:yes gene_type:complete